MKQKTIVLIVALALLLAGAGIGYRYLSKAQPVAPLSPAVSSSSAAVSSSSAVAGSSAASEEAPPEPMEAPDFSFYDIDGNAVKLSDYRGKPVVVNFWASWCGPCQEEMPDFETVYTEMGEEITFLMISLVDGGRETEATARQFIEKNGYTFPVYFDIDQEGAYTYGIRSIPTSLFIDAEGYLIAGQPGMLNEEILRYGITLIRGETKE